MTLAYLRATWQSPRDIHFMIGGGNDGVHALVNMFAESGYQNVFGVTDRDFRQSNVDQWLNESKNFRTFVLPVHEIENYLLDADALHSSVYHNRKLDLGDIEEKMTDIARGQCWWAACRDVIAELKRRFREPFVSDPKLSVTDENSAFDHICNSDWFSKLQSELERSTQDEIRQLLINANQQSNLAIHNGEWKKDFAGKEILRNVGNWICDRPSLVVPPPNGVEYYVDLAKQIAGRQVRNNSVPSDVIQLRQAISARIARIPKP